MYKKIISSILVIAFLNLLGCYTFQPVTVPEYKQIEEQEDKPDEIYVITKDDQKYHFLESNYYIENDTLYGKEIVITYFESGHVKNELPFDRKIAISEIETIEVDSYSLITTVILYGVETKQLGQAVKRNKERFPDDFMFQLSNTEFENLRSQIVTSKRGGRSYRPLAFTE
jgi:hypothetical protein